jgi:ergothioneine biosynthesis glutamate--cysteine ligase EgtA
VSWPANEPRDDKLTEDQAEAHVHGICFKTGPPQRVGVELEWLVRDARDPALPVPAERIFPAVADLTAPAVLPSPAALPTGSMLTTEPGGQLELSSAPADSLGECVTAVRREMATLRETVRRASLALQGYGYDPLRPPRRVLQLPRYAAMEEFFDRAGPWGREMMCNTASVQVCLDAGLDTAATGGYRWRWRLAHRIGPVLVAAFANSALRQGRLSGWRSTRQEVWGHLDPGRTLPPVTGGDPRDAYTAYALDAELMLVRRPGSPSWAAPRGLTFRGWLRGDGNGERPPTADDLTYHLSTLFPPVRPRGHLELRMIDAQPGDGWIVPAAVAWALFEDPRAADAAMAATEPLWDGQDDGAAGAAPGPRPFGQGDSRSGGPGSARSGDRRHSPGHGHRHSPSGGRARPGHGSRNGHRVENGAPDGNPWLRAARDGPADPVIARASRQCFEAADAALGRAGIPADIRRRVAEFAERYVTRRRCPADDQLEGMP